MLTVLGLLREVCKDIFLRFLYLDNKVNLKASPVAQMVENLPAMQETQVRSLGGKIPGEGNGN